jgi:hypothetical protein
METGPDPKKSRPSNSYLKYANLAFQLLVAVGAAAWLGYKIDQHFEFKFPVFLLTLVFAVFAGMFYQAYRSLNQE